MQIFELNRTIGKSGEIVTKYEVGKKSVELVGTFGNRTILDDLLYSIACQRLSEQLAQRRDNLVFEGENGIIIVGK